MTSTSLILWSNESLALTLSPSSPKHRLLGACHETSYHSFPQLRPALPLLTRRWPHRHLEARFLQICSRRLSSYAHEVFCSPPSSFPDLQTPGGPRSTPSSLERFCCLYQISDGSPFLPCPCPCRRPTLALAPSSSLAASTTFLRPFGFPCLLASSALP